MQGGATLKEDSVLDLGIIITCVLPGCIVLWGIGQLFPPLADAWISVNSLRSATVGSFFYIILASIGAGMTIGCARWLVIDTLHHWTGLRPPRWDFAKLAERTEAFHLLIEIHYKYYLFYANSLTAALFAYVAWRSRHSLSAEPIGWADAGSLAICLMFAAGSRDTLRRYYRRAGELLRQEETPPRIIALK
ncbi:MAG: hypothetical protein KDA44_02520 [Planctomycetales bacterium]|nr:hypothetical protein [Planctomycetales bacterium]